MAKRQRVGRQNSAGKVIDVMRDGLGQRTESPVVYLISANAVSLQLMGPGKDLSHKLLSQKFCVIYLWGIEVRDSVDL